MLVAECENNSLTVSRSATIVNHMVKYNQEALDNTFSALSDGTRRAILARLAQGEALVTELAAPFDISLPAVSKHLNVLERAGLIRREKDGRIRRCHLQVAPLKEVAEWLQFYQQFWGTQLDSLVAYLENTKKQET